MARSQSYRDMYEGRGKYALENDTMLNSESVRLTAWQNESTQYKRSFIWPSSLAILFLAAVAAAMLGYFAFGNLQ
jgi:hypothetical protein